MYDLIVSIASLFQGHPYVFLSVGLLLGGETILLPAIFASLIGYLNLMLVSLVAILAALVSDSVWYVLGRTIPFSKFKNFSFIKRNSDNLGTASASIQKNGLQFLFISKFIYGARTLAQILAGANRIPYPQYLAVNTVGTAVLISVIVGIGTVLDRTFADLAGWRLPVFFAVFIGLVVLAQLCIKKVMAKYWLR